MREVESHHKLKDMKGSWVWNDTVYLHFEKITNAAVYRSLLGRKLGNRKIGDCFS